jgi:hypothetical protein
MLVPDLDCSREVRGNVTPYFANMYFVNPEQSNPSFGVLPPQTYFTPRYDSAVLRTRDAVADGGGESGIRRREGDGAGPPGIEVEVVVVVDDGMLAMTVARMLPGDTPTVAGEQPVRMRKGAAAIAPTLGNEGVTMPIVKAGGTPTMSESTNSCRAIR